MGYDDVRDRIEALQLKSQGLQSTMQAMECAIFRDTESTKETYEVGFYFLIECLRGIQEELRSLTKEMYKTEAISA